ncbi:MAG: ATP-dependent DNA helicase [Candidatus Saccharibacteria bacterium]
MELLWVSEYSEKSRLKVDINNGSYEHVTEAQPELFKECSAPAIVLHSQTVDLSETYRLFYPDRSFNAGIAANAGEMAKIAAELWDTATSLGLSNLKQAVMTLASTDSISLFLNQVIDSLILDRIIAGDEVCERPAAREINFDKTTIIQDFMPGGLLENRLAEYQYRNQQVLMAEEVCKAIEDNDFLMAEAGTGVGKSLAYLVPAIYWSAAESEKVVIATRTKALQRQIAEKDLPMLEEALPFPFKYEIAYGRDNYLCRSRLSNLFNQLQELSSKQRRIAAALALWLERGGSGQIADLYLDTDEMEVWYGVRCSRYSCTGRECRFFNKCCYFNARKRLASADIIVTNHALLLSDISAEGKLLPEYRYLVVDEAHNLERNAFDKLGAGFVLDDGLRILSRLFHKRSGFDRGYLIALQASFPNLVNEISRVKQDVERSRRFIEELTLIPQGLKYEPGGQRRIKANTRGVRELADGCGATATALGQVEVGLYSLMEELENREEENELREYLGEISDAANNLMTISDVLGSGNQDYVSWIDQDDGVLRVVACAPLELGAKLHEMLYSKLNTAIFVSATLTVGKNFDFMKQRLGLNMIEQDRMKTWYMPSPFDYEANCRTMLIKDAAQPGTPDYLDTIVDCVIAAAEACSKRILVLFTAKSLMLQAADSIAQHSPDLDRRLISQYRDGEYAVLLSRLESMSDAILLGTETFWEGVDLPGELLSCLIVTRLPFRPPSEPLTEAVVERMESQGKNGFYGYSLPEAVIRFKQGLGRLIRSETDSGVIIILDSRLRKPPAGKGYSPLFRDGIPMQPLVEINMTDLTNEMQKWFKV